MKLNKDWKPDKNLQIPLYEQIEVYIKNMITNGNWRIGSKIPSQRILASQFNVNRSTVVTAIEDLIAEDILESKPKSGVIVKNSAWPLISRTPPDWDSYIKSGSYQPNMETVREININESTTNMIKLGAGELAPELFPDNLMNIISKSMLNKENSLSYEHPKGSIDLRNTLKEYLETLGIDVSVEQILIVSGVIQAINLISQGILYKGSTILTEKPSYIYSLRTFQSAGMKLFGIPVDKNGFDVDRLIKYRRQRNAAILYTIPTFQNPTGISMTDDQKKDLINKCNEELLPIIEDDTYNELFFNDIKPKPLKAFDKNDSVLYLGSVSKTLCPGLRIGWIVGNKSVIDRLADVKMQTDYGSSSLSQIALNEIMSKGYYADYLKTTRCLLRKRRDFTLSILKKHFSDIAEWNIPQGGYYIWLEIKGNISAKEVYNICLAENLLINPGNIYNSHSNNFIRISYSYATYAELEFGLIKLSNIIRNCKTIP